MYRYGYGYSVPLGTLLNYNWAEQPEVLFYGLYSEIAGGQMPNKVTGSTDYLTVAGSAGSETYQAPNTTPYKNADTDYIWFKTDASQRTTTTAELIGYDFPRTIVKYADSSPYAIESIMILKAGETLSEAKENAMRDAFHLSNWWDGTLSLHGVVKGNRSSAKATWTPESVAPEIPTGLTLTLISGGVQIDWTDTNAGAAQTEIWGKSDAGTSALLYTIAAGTVTKNDTVAPVDLRYYKIRALKDGNYSGFTAEASIAMLGPNKVVNGTFDVDLNWTKGTGWTISGNVLNANCTSGNYETASQSSVFVIGETYKVDFDMTISANILQVGIGGNQYSETYTTAGHKTFTILKNSNPNTSIFFIANNRFTGTIDNVVVKKVLAP